MTGGGPKFATTDYDLGARRWHATGETLPDSVLEELRGHDAILLGAIGDPACRAACSSAASCCRCASPSTTTSTCGPPGSTRGREPARRRTGSPPTASTSSSCARAPRGRTPATAGPARRHPAEIATEVSVNTRYGVERVVRDAFARAQARPRRTSRSSTSTTSSRTPATSGAAPSRRSGRVPRRRDGLPARRRRDDLHGRPQPLRRHRHRQPLRRHPHRHRRRPSPAASASRPPATSTRPARPEHVRARPRLGARHRRPGQGRPDRGCPVRRVSACSPTSGLDAEAERVEAPSRPTWPSTRRRARSTDGVRRPPKTRPTSPARPTAPADFAVSRCGR